MSDLRRWSEEDATAEELALLEVARQRRASPAQRAAVLSALGMGVATTAAGAAGAAGSAGAMSLTTKIVALALLAGAGVSVALVHSGAEKPTALPAPSAIVVSSSAPVSSASAPAPALVLDEPPASAPSEASAKGRAKSKPAAVASSSLSRELQVLKQAHDAIARGNPKGALSALDDYHARFPQGALGAEETVIRVQALLALGDRARATSIARQFSAAHPDSLYAQRVERLVSGAK